MHHHLKVKLGQYHRKEFVLIFHRKVVKSKLFLHLNISRIPYPFSGTSWFLRYTFISISFSSRFTKDRKLCTFRKCQK